MILYKAVKQKKPSIVFVFFVALRMLFVLVVPCFKNLFLGKIDFNSASVYKNSTFTLMLLIPLSIMSIAPFIISLIMSALYFGGINKVGKQLNIEVHGTVTSKSYQKNTRGGGNTYDFIITEIGQNKEYNLHVSYDVYTHFQNNEYIAINAKKGILGIIYDVEVRNY